MYLILLAYILSQECVPLRLSDSLSLATPPPWDEYLGKPLQPTKSLQPLSSLSAGSGG